MTTTLNPGQLTFIAAKNQSPQPPPALLHREKFNDLLHDLEPVSLLLVHAPAGYGKTTTVADRLDVPEATTAWYRLEAGDNDPARFAGYLAKALEVAVPGSCAATLRKLQEQGYDNSESFLTDLLAELPLDEGPVYLVLDDYHLISNPEIHDALRFLLRHQPASLTLVLITRTVPPIGVAQLRMQGRMSEITSRDLAFGADEAQQYFDSRLPFEISRESIERAVRRVEGWVSALQLLSASAVTSIEFNDFVDQLEFGNQHIFDYFDELVGHGLTDQQRKFLLRTSILDRFNARMVMRVMDDSNGQALLSGLLAMGLFINPVDNSALWFRYHPLFSVYLRHLLNCTTEENRQQLHQRACDAWLELDHAEEAARHAIEADDPERITRVLTVHGQKFFTEGQFMLLQRCLDALPQDVIARDPTLTLLRAWVAQGQYQFDEVENWLSAAEARLAASMTEDTQRAVYAEFSAIRAQVAMNYGDGERALVLAREAIDQEARYLPTSRVAAASVIGEALFVQGELEEALVRMQETEHLARAHQAHQNVIWALCQQSEISVAMGLLQKAYNIQERGFQYAEENNLNHLPILEFLFRIRSQIMWEWHHLENAERCALQGIEILEAQGERWYVQSYTSLAKVAHARGSQSLCADYIAKIQKMLASGDYHLDWVANAHATMLAYWDAVRDHDAIQRWLTIAPPVDPDSATNHFNQCNGRNRARAYMSLGLYSKAQPLLSGLQTVAEQVGLKTDLNRNHIALALLYWNTDDRENALRHMVTALQLASTTGAVGSFLRMGKVLIVILKALINDEAIDGMELQRAERLIQLAQQQRDFSRAIRISLDEAIIQDIIDRPDVPELIRTSPLTRREWQILSLIHAGLSNDQIAEHLKVASTTVKTHIRSLYQKQNISHRSEAIELAKDLLSKIQGE
ncbi:HTH-type transcriptional regulator MalT [Marinobacter sp. HL-58]|uniref:HTH-type transcriptional regulator MalT n=1 Tax=Marinobacter sp. HL-58 TaxID=1479237 RepID=UPI000480A2A4|nr:HTH-type transcriptional regulator MalT [Marinobacter sp. HL-58]KPP98973.1 MAG: LuxR family transcriptional regulator, maltose regulon positive regulatory protein [Marinobacter sp. HL-58]